MEVDVTVVGYRARDGGWVAGSARDGGERGVMHIVIVRQHGVPPIDDGDVIAVVVTTGEGLAGVDFEADLGGLDRLQAEAGNVSSIVGQAGVAEATVTTAATQGVGVARGIRKGENEAFTAIEDAVAEVGAQAGFEGERRGKPTAAEE